MAGLKERLIQFVLRGKDELSPEAKKSEEALNSLKEASEQLGQALDNAKEAQGLAKALEQTQRAVEVAKRNLGDAEKQVTDLRDALSKTPEAAGLQQSLKDAEREASRSRRQLNALTQQLADAEKAAKAAGVNTDGLSDEQQRLAGEVDKARRALDENNAQLKAVQREQAAAARATAEHGSRVESLRGAMSAGAKQILGFAAAYVSLNAAMGLVQRGLSLVSQGIRAVAMDGSDKQQALAQLEATLASTGRQAEFTTQQLLDMADAMESSSMLTAEQVQSAQARLLSYTDVAANEFPRALQIVIDQQQRLGISAEQSAEIVGRALQSPSKAMAALGRQGFTLEAGQQRLLKQLEATGRMAEAQSIIMDMLTEAYGGAAAAARMNTFQGLLKDITDRFGDFASQVANSGAFEYMQRKLVDLSDYLDQMASDGRLDRLAEGLSKGFIQGVEWAERFAKKLLDIDFQKATDDAAAWFSSLGQHLDETQQKLAAFVLPFRALFNGLTSGLSLVAAAVTSKMSEVLGLVDEVAKRLPDAIGGERLRNSVRAARESLDGLTAGFVAQVEQDGKDIQSAWDAAMGGIAESTETKMAEVTETIKLESVSQADFVRQAVTSMQGALDQISTAKTVAQLRQVGDEMYAAYKRGDISQQEYAAGSVELNRRLTELGGAAKSMAGDVGIAAESLESLTDVQRAISDAKTDRDITAIRTAIKRLYDEGKIGAAEYNAELAKLSARQKELTQALQGSKKAQDDKNDSDKEAIVTSEQLRRESGKRMEAERKAGDEAMQRRRKESSAAQRDMSAMEDFYSGVMSRAREGVAGLSRAALEAFDALRNISTASPSIDTSSLDATRTSLESVSKALGDVRAALAMPMQSSLARWMAETQQASLQTQQAFLSQKASLQSLMQSYERGSITAQQFVRRANSMKHALSLLDESDLSGLESAIEAANQRMQQMGQSTRSTLESLQDELDGLQGRQDDIERRRFAARQRELQAQLAEAQASGDAQAVANASRALGLLRQIESESAQQRQAEEQKKRMEAEQARQAEEQEKRMEAEQATQPAPTQQPEQPSKVIRLEIPGSPAVDVSVSGDAAEADLLSILEQAGLRSL
ncbi:Prophage tail length tape measure protein [Ectopseudomonas chengduensis]|uniref:Prophage tail length tape measure protein n=1 Tax=Ectopseudomonas chengduensis TaxID=489632 RepID=A0A1G6P0Q1_9GAMM|nr:phage tail length tape measure family protein [Pseudomonas chengduensis]MBP3063651.1 tape measure domain-containing protein [Pseudomonas chengduensis]NNB73470.1 tape measure domain-containing protein [Pseudomonas chengduensis]SDC73850.1 Prophage tail length tape measure protein [Pseudomonas chengduensis]